MYSPKISEELVFQLYHIAKQKRIPMTRLVNQLLYKAISEMENRAQPNCFLHDINVNSFPSEEKPNSSIQKGDV
jgi:hypothetical protein